jgi:DNA polymerase-4
VLPVRRDRYEELSQKVFEIFLEFTPLVEPLSIDEAFLDVTDCFRLHGTGSQIASSIKKAVRQRTGLTASAGVAPIKMAAKIAAGLCKPDGLLVVSPDELDAFLAPLPISRLWGVGPAAQKKLLLLGVKTIADARILPLDLLEKQLGSLGRQVFALSRGQDDRQVTPARESLSIGREKTFLTDISDREKAHKKIFALCQSVAKRLRKENFSGKTLTLKVKYSDFSQVSRSMSLERPCFDAAELFAACLQLAEKTRIGAMPVRLLGVGVSRPEKQEQCHQQSIFDLPERADKKKRLNRAIDNIAELYGDKAIIPAMLVDEDSQ